MHKLAWLYGWFVEWVRFYWDNLRWRLRGYKRVAPKGVRGRIWAAINGESDPQAGNKHPAQVRHKATVQIKIKRAGSDVWEIVEWQ